MTAFRDALTQLAALDVTGVTHYGIAAVPDVLPRALLPALLVLPGDAQDDRLFKQYGRGFEAIAFVNAARTLSLTVTHLLLLAPVGTDVGIRGHMPELIDAIDGYIAALGDDVTLGGTLAEPTRVTVEIGTFGYGGMDYHGCAFRHTWMLEINVPFGG